MKTDNGNVDVPAAVTLSGFVIGALTGAAVALLLAPADGRTTRRYLGRKARDGRRRVRQVVENTQTVMTRQRRRLAEAASEGRKHLSQAGEHVIEAAREGRAAIRDVAHDVTARSGLAGR